MADEPFQSLYRRYRPQRFAEVRGQHHITTALRNSVRHGRVGHAYLFSGPRGTGKTSTARILAAALNCANPVDGEPDGTCESCVAIRTGSSLDVLELDAASNNGVDAMRDLVTRAALGSPGRSKIYIVDEVHMLTTGASNALLKTLEDPPAHVVFILATTDDQKVLPTIRSRTQHYHFRLLAPEVLTTLLADINDLADLGLDAGTLDQVVRRGNGSARDALSALDQAAAAGGAEDEGDVVSGMVEALIAHDPGAALVAMAEAARRGRDPHRLAIELVEHLRAGFLLVMAPDIAGVPIEQRDGLLDQARRLGTPATVRAMEVLGETLVDMRESLDTRVTLELTLIRLCAPAADTSPAAILERLELVERRLASAAVGPSGSGAPPAPVVALGRPGGQPVRPDAEAAPPAAPTKPPAAPTRVAPTPAAPTPAAPTPAAPTPAAPTPAEPTPAAPTPAAPTPAAPTPAAPGPPAGRPTIGAMRQRQGPSGPPTPPREPPRQPSAGPAPSGSVVILDRDELTKVWGDQIFGGLSPRARAVYRNGRWLEVDGATATFALPADMYRGPAEDKRVEVETALADYFGGRVVVRLVIGDVELPEEPQESGGRPADGPAPVVAEDEDIDPTEFAELPTAPDMPSSAAARLLKAFPGSEEIDE